VEVSSPAELLDALATADDIEMDGSLAGMAGLDEVPVTAAHGQRIVSRTPNEEGEER
jgi:hypothetical protein